MRSIILIIVFVSVWCFPSFSQITEKTPQKEPLLKNYKIPKDKNKLKFGGNDSLLFKDNIRIRKDTLPTIGQNQDTSIEIPNLLKGKKLSESGNLIQPESKDDSYMPNKKLDGSHNVPMPGTEKLNPLGMDVKIDTMKVKKISKKN